MSAKLDCNLKVTHIATGSNCMVNDSTALVSLVEALENSCQFVDIGVEEFAGRLRYIFIQPQITGGLAVSLDTKERSW